MLELRYHHVGMAADAAHPKHDDHETCGMHASDHSICADGVGCMLLDPDGSGDNVIGAFIGDRDTPIESLQFDRSDHRIRPRDAKLGAT